MSIRLRSNIDKRVKAYPDCVFVKRQGELPMAKSIFLKENDVMAMREKLAGCNQATRGPDRKDKYETLIVLILDNMFNLQAKHCSW